MSTPSRRSDKPSVLFDALFAHSDQSKTLALIATGLTTVLDHVRELLTEVEILVEARRYARARFLIATADEELGKCHVLLDCARLDVRRHESNLRRLSKAFYDHVDKYAYVQLWRLCSPQSHSWWNMGEAFGIFNSHRVEFWRAASASDDEPPTEPDMPHNTYFHREMNLYVDLLESERWWVSPPSYGEHEFDRSHALRYWREGSIVTFELRDQTKYHLEAFDRLRTGEALSQEALRAMNDVWRQTYVNRAWRRNQLDALWRKTADAVARASTLTQDDLFTSPLCFWPCYHGLQIRPEDC